MNRAALLIFAAFCAAASGAEEPFRGENCKACHDAIRNRVPTASSTKVRDAGEFDVIVVGGGLSGLTAAYQLRDKKILLLEKDSKVGGKMRRESYGRHLYPVAGVYMSKPTGALKELFTSLKLKGKRITITEHTLWNKGEFIEEWLSGDAKRLPLSADGREKFAKFQKDLRTISKSNQLTIPVEESDPKALAKYDAVSYNQWLTDAYGPEVALLGEMYCRSVLGITCKQLSAVAGIMYMASEFEPVFTWEGGLGKISETFADALGARVSTGAFVWNVSDEKSDVIVRYSDAAGEARAKARYAVLAVPSFIAKRLVTGLPPEREEALSQVRYSSYALIPLNVKKVFWRGAFDLWIAGKSFTDVLLPLPNADALRNSAEEVVVVYMPMGESEGRQALLARSDSDITSQVLRDLDTVFNGIPKEVAEARVIRWGHAMPIAYPGYLTKVRPLLTKNVGRLFFAGVDTQLPAMEGAMHSGLRAASAIRNLLAKPVSNQ